MAGETFSSVTGGSGRQDSSASRRPTAELDYLLRSRRYGPAALLARPCAVVGFGGRGLDSHSLGSRPPASPPAELVGRRGHPQRRLLGEHFRCLLAGAVGAMRA